MRAAVAVLVIGFDAIAGAEQSHRSLRALGLAGLCLNLPYFIAAESLGWRRAQAYVRMLIDVGLVTAGLHAVGGLAAAPYVAIYAVIVLYAGLALSSTACLLAAGVATVAYVAVGVLQGPPDIQHALPNAWAIASFNLLVLNVIAAVTAVLGDAYRKSRRALAALNRELERAHDESQRLNVAIQRSAQLRVLGEVVAGVTHEIRNVLQTVVGHLSMARRKLAQKPEEVLEHLDQMDAAWRHAIRIIESTLATARPPAARLTEVSLGDIARRTLELKGYDLRRDRIAVRVDVAPDLRTVRADPTQVQQVLLNLLTNAQDALRQVPGPRRIDIRARQDGEDTIVEVRDTGHGIAPDLLPRIFEPFITTKPEGTGLGLAVSAGIIRELGGGLSAENHPQGGAVFRITLPMRK